MGEKTNLYEILNLNEPHQFHMIHAGDKYLSSSEKSLNQAKFIELLKTDLNFVSSMPEWDNECQDVAKELFTLLDTNEDGVLNQDDLEFYVKPEEKIPRLSQTIANKNKEFNEIGFDMKIRKAGAIDFTLPQENIESIIQAATSQDYEHFWKNQKEEENTKETENQVKDEL